MNFLKNKVLRNTLWISVGQVVELLIALVFGILITRYLTEADFGMMNNSIAAMNTLLPLATLSTSGIVMKKLVENKESEGTIIGTMLFFRLGSGVISALLLLAFAFLFNADDQLMKYLCVIQTFALIVNFHELFATWYNFKLQAYKYVIFRLITCILVCVYKGLILHSQLSVEWFCYSNVLDSILITIICFLSYKKNSDRTLSINFSLGKQIIVESRFFIVSGVLTALLIHVDKFILQKMISKTDVGIYTAAVYIGTLWGFVLNAMIESARATIISAKNENMQLYKRRMQQLYSAVIWSGILVAICITLVSPYLLTILYGEKYSNGGVILGIICWSVVFQFIVRARNVWFILENKNKYELIFTAFGIVVNVIMNLLLIPQFGLIGAAISAVLTQFGIAIIVPAIFPATRKSSLDVLNGLLCKWFFSKDFEG